MKIMVVNTKGGASKSTFSFQVLGAYFLDKGIDAELVELDDENKDSDIFKDSEISTSTAFVGQSRDDVAHTLQERFKEANKSFIFDIGGNKTTTLVLEALKRTRLYHLVDCFLIPMSGGSQDFINAKNTYEIVKNFEKPIIFGLSRVRDLNQMRFQYMEFFREFPNAEYIFLTDSNVIDLSRMLKKSVYEIAKDTIAGGLLKDYDQLIAKEYKGGEMSEKGNELAYIVRILEDSVEYQKNILAPCFEKLDRVLG